MKILKEIKTIINNLEQEGYRVKVWKDSEGEVNWISDCKCSGYTEGKNYRTFWCKEHVYIPEFEEEEEEEDVEEDD